MLRKIKKRLSSAWRMFKYKRTSTRLNMDLLTQYRDLGEVELSEIRQLFTRLKPMKCKTPLVRIGSDYDGGYLLADDFKNLTGSFSPGVSDTLDFDLAIAEKGIPCFLADASIDGLTTEHTLFDFEKKFLGGRTSGEFMTVDDWMDRKAPAHGDLLLQMDIEGAEFEVVAHCKSETLKRFRQIVIEVHDADMVVSREGFVRFSSLLDSLLEHHDIIHIHNNNSAPLAHIESLEFSRVFELTLLRRDRLDEGTSDIAPIPHPLDARCVPKLPDFHMPITW